MLARESNSETTNTWVFNVAESVTFCNIEIKYFVFWTKYFSAVMIAMAASRIGAERIKKYRTWNRSKSGRFCPRSNSSGSSTSIRRDGLDGGTWTKKVWSFHYKKEITLFRIKHYSLNTKNVFDIFVTLLIYLMFENVSPFDQHLFIL
jgi:hypothetical protein